MKEKKIILHGEDGEIHMYIPTDYKLFFMKVFKDYKFEKKYMCLINMGGIWPN